MKRHFSKHFVTIATLFGVLIIRSSLADHYYIPSGSMEPTLRPGDHVLVLKSAYDLKLPFLGISLWRHTEPHRGDIIVFEDPRNPQIQLIKRLIGVPGDHIHIQNGWVTLNGRPLPTEEEPDSEAAAAIYQESLDGQPHSVQRLPRLARAEDQSFTVPQDQYFFLGDNRDNSADSRTWGFAPRHALNGKALRILYNFSWPKSGKLI